jgi:hypothetical protein
VGEQERREVSAALATLVATPRGRLRLMLVTLLSDEFGEWKPEQIERTAVAVEGLAMAFGVTPEDVLVGIGEAKKRKARKA